MSYNSFLTVCRQPFAVNRLTLNFLLKNLEVSLSESHLLVGEKLLDNQQVATLYESERNLWVAEVDGFEIEMQISPSRVKACSCECGVFLEQKMCGHVAAGLLALRKHLTEKKASKKAIKKTYQKLTVNAILDQVGKEGLSAFVRYYARGNRAFSNALKTRFAGLVPMSDNAEKYRQVIDSVMVGARNKNDRISAVGARQLLRAGNDLLGQANDAMALDHYVDTWSVLQVLIEKLVPIINRTDFETEAFSEFIEKCFNTLHTLAGQSIPPSLKSEIWEYLKAVAPRPIYRGYDISVYFYQQLFPLADDKTKRSALLAIVDKELKFSHKFSEKIIKELLAVKLSILKQRGFAKQLNLFLEEILETPEQVLSVASVAIENKFLKIAKTIANKGLDVNNHALFQHRLKLKLLDIAIVEKDKKNIVKWAHDCFLYNGQIKYIRLCKQFHKNDWGLFIENIADKIKSENPLKKNEYLANLYSEEKYIPELSEIIRGNNSLDFLMKYDTHFLPTHQKELYGLYTELMDIYFSNHIGERPTRKMLHIFNHLRQINAPSLVDQLVGFVRKNHPRRMELAMELMVQ